MKRTSSILLAIICLILNGGLRTWAATPATTTATLAGTVNTVASGSIGAGQIAPGAMVTLIATVASGGFPVTTGQVNFCDARVTYCTDIYLLGTRSEEHTS